MAYLKPDPFAMEHDDRLYMTSPMHRPSDAFPGPKGPDPLSGNWNYDSAIDLFSLNTNLMPEPFQLDMPNEVVSIDPKEFPANFFAPPPEFCGFTISNHSGEDAASSDPDSDDQSWSPDYHPSDTTTSTRREKQQTRRNTDTTLHQLQDRAQRWSSSPQLHPQEYSTQSASPPPASPTGSSNRKMTRSLSGDSNASSTGQTTSSGRNAAKRAAHNIIEKRYRTNMNAKFVALEKAMCGGAQKQTKGGSASLKKSEILTNAIVYMQELQEQNRALHKELDSLKQTLVPGGGMWRPTRE